MSAPRDFWLSCGHHLLDRDAVGNLLLTDEFIKAYLARPELVPPPEACLAERKLHVALLSDPKVAVAASQLAAIADDPNPIGEEDLIDLLELGDEQPVKGVFETDIALAAPLSHVRALLTETPISRVVQSRSGSARCSRNRPATPERCCSGS